MVTGGYDSDHDGDQVADLEAKRNMLPGFCVTPRSREEMMEYVGIASKRYFRENFIRPLLESGQLKMTLPDKPKSKNQKYVKA